MQENIAAKCMLCSFKWSGTNVLIQAMSDWIGWFAGPNMGTEQKAYFLGKLLEEAFFLCSQKHQQRFVWNKYKGKMARGRASITGKAEGINRKSKEEGVAVFPTEFDWQVVSGKGWTQPFWTCCLLQGDLSTTNKSYQEALYCFKHPPKNSERSTFCLYVKLQRFNA